MKCFFLLLCFALSLNLVLAQEELGDFGEVSMQELKMTHYPLDSSADAVVLFDKGETRINGKTLQGSLFRRHTRIKIINKQAYEDWGTVMIVAERGAVSKIKGASYHLEGGQIVKAELSNSMVFKARQGKFIDVITFTFPNLTEGSVLEYSYSVFESQFGLPSWSFQASIPTARSEYSIYVPFTPFKSDLRGKLRITDYETKGNNSYHRWMITNIPAFEAEPLMPHHGIYKSALNFWPANSSWHSINYDMLENEAFGNITNSRFLKHKAEELIAREHDPQQKLKVISDYIKQAITWDGTTDFLAADPKTVFDRKTGSSGDINLIFGALLANAGLKVNMVLLSTRSHGLVLHRYPSLRQFNYVVCRVVAGKDTLLVDATEKYLPHDALPERCLNYDGFLIDSKDPRWITVTSRVKSSTMLNGELKITDNGDLQGTLIFNRKGYDALDARQQYDNVGKEAYLKTFLSDKTWQVEKSEIQGADDRAKPFTETYDVVITDATTQAGELMYINPFIALRETSNPFVVDKRSYPVDFGIPGDRIFYCTIDVPDDYIVEEMPKSKVITTEDKGIKCTVNTSQTGNRIFITNSLQLRKTLFMEEEYPALKEFYARYVAKTAEQIVLRKKK